MTDSIKFIQRSKEITICTMKDDKESKEPDYDDDKRTTGRRAGKED